MVVLLCKRASLNWLERKRFLSQRAVEILYNRGAILFGEFILTSGMKSPYYIDLRVLPSYPNDFNEICDMYSELIRNEVEAVDRIAGVPTAGIPFATLIAHKLNKPLIYVRKKTEREHGRGRLVEGVLERGDQVILIDDVATTGGSLILTANSIRFVGGEIAGAVVLVDREQGAADNLKQVGVRLHYLVKITDAAEFLLESDVISRKMYDAIVQMTMKD